MGAGLAVGLDALTNAEPSGPNALTGDDLAGFTSATAYSFGVIKDVFDSADGKANDSVTVATDAGVQAGKMGQNIKDITHHIIDVIIPHSLAWESGYIVSKYITPIWAQLTAIRHRLDALERWEAQIRVWRAKFVDPHIMEWIGWHEWFDGWPRGVVFRVHQWLEDPSVFGKWAAAPVIGPIVSYLSVREHHTTRDNLALIMVQAWAEEPNAVWERVMTWLLAGK